MDEAIPCGNDNTFQPAFLSSTVRFAVDVTDPDGDAMSVTFYFDYLRPNPMGGPPEVNPDSPMANIAAVPTEPGKVALVQASWTYATLSNFTNQKYWVYIEARDINGEFDSAFGTLLFSVVVVENSEPFVDGLLSVYSVSPPMTYQAKIVPPLLVDVSVGDLDGDPLTVTWDWGDGTSSVNSISGSFDNTPIGVSHVYPASLFPLNETPRVVDLTFDLWVDDGLGHNVSSTAIAQYDIEFDRLPSVQVTSPVVGSRWKVGEPVPIEGTASDLEGDSMVYFIDFDSGREPDTAPCTPVENCDGIPDNDRDFIGNKTSHVYEAAGDYNITLWATDGVEKKFCLDAADCEPSLSHWRSQTIPFQVSANRKPFIALANQSALADEFHVFRVAVFDLEGDSLTVTWDFGDGSDKATNVTVSTRDEPRTIEVFRSHRYENAGVYRLTVEVTDGSEPVNATAQIIVESFNEPPGIIRVEVLRTDGTAANNNTFAINEPVGLRITLFDVERDDLEVRVDWDDGNTTVVDLNLREWADCFSDELNRLLCALTISHVYGDAGGLPLKEYRAMVTVTDHQEFFQWNYTENRPERIQPHEVMISLPLYVTGPNQLPVASFVVRPPRGPLGTVFAVDASASFDPEDPSTQLQVRWDWEADGIWDTPWSFEKFGFHAYENVGDYMIRLQVRDTQGSTAEATRIVTVDPPSAGGLLRVFLDNDYEPELPIPGTIVVDGIPRSLVSLTGLPLAPGTHVVSFTPVPGFETPSPRLVEIRMGEATSIRVLYRVLGALLVRTEPSVDGRIFVDGVPRDKGSILLTLTPGSYLVSFGPVPGYRPPPRPLLATVLPGMITEAVGRYRAAPGYPAVQLQKLGTLRVDIEVDSGIGPAFVSTTVLVNGIARDLYGLEGLQLSPGTYTVAFTEVPGLSAPPPQVVSLMPGATVQIRAVFNLLGALLVRTEPVAGTISVDGIPRNQGIMGLFLPPGAYEVSFDPVPGYATPTAEQVEVRAGQITLLTGTYLESSGLGEASTARPGSEPVGPGFLFDPATNPGDPVSAATPTAGGGAYAGPFEPNLPAVDRRLRSESSPGRAE